MRKKEKSKVVGVIYFCDNLKKEIIIRDYIESSFYGYESECELCGSHGAVKFTVNCECGKMHEIEINSW